MATAARSSRQRVWALTTGLVLTLLCTSAGGQGRIIVVNGQLLDDEGIQQVDELNCGEPVPDGNYWIDLTNGIWGYVGVADQNPLPECSSDQNPGPAETEGSCESQYPVHEDRMCYCYHVC